MSAASAPLADPGLPVPGPLADLLTAGRDEPPQPPGGGEALRRAAAGRWERHGTPTAPGLLLCAPGPGPLLLALLAATGGDLVLPVPAAPWYAPPARLLGRRIRPVPAPAGYGGVPDPVTLLEDVRRAGDGSGGPALLVLAAADPVTGTVVPPELMHEVCEAAAAAGLLLLADETFAGLAHDPRTVVLGPAAIVPDRTIAVADLGADTLPAGWPAALARFPAGGPAAAPLAAARAALAAQGAVLPGPVGAAAALALADPPWALDRTRAAVRLHGAVARAVHAELLRLGALCPPPRAGFQLYPDFEPLRPALAAAGVADADDLARRLPGGLPGHRFGDPPERLRARIAVPALYGEGRERAEALAAADPLGVPRVAEAVAGLGRAFAEPMTV